MTVTSLAITGDSFSIILSINAAANARPQDYAGEPLCDAIYYCDRRLLSVKNTSVRTSMLSRGRAPGREVGWMARPGAAGHIMKSSLDAIELLYGLSHHCSFRMSIRRVN